ncbi:MAG TPA: winged helix DNA-binding domain-containing protein [Acidimicrobiia bacterium]|nr:winged helix DNA-binding domain-containing protein [Acidimicrobiia bacterium]
MRIDDSERRRRLVWRHHLGRSAADPLEAVEGVAAFHSSDPVTPYLGMWARISDFEREQLDEALYEARVLWRMHAMRRTLFVVPSCRWPVFEAGASRDIARQERRRLEQWLAAEMPADTIPTWLEETSARVMEVVEKGEFRTQELSGEVPELNRQIMMGSGKWRQKAPVSSRLLFLLAMEGSIVRTHPTGSWRSSGYRWTAASSWWDRAPSPMNEEEGRTALARRYLESHGPVTLVDLRWWTGWTAAKAKAALSRLEVVKVTLDSGDEGYVLADDAEFADEPAPTTAFLPGLDPTPMGWKERDWYLGPHGQALFDANGNVGPTVWVDGRIVGGWGQRPGGEVVFELLDEPRAEAVDRIEEEAGELATWLDGEVVSIRFKTPLERKLARS